MKTPIAGATVALAAMMFVPMTFAQTSGGLFKRSAKTAANAPVDPNVSRASTKSATPTQEPASGELARPTNTPIRAINPEPLKDNSEVPAPEDVKGGDGPQIPLPTGPIEPYMLTKENGPFMVLAYSFRGPDAPRQALALVLELRNQYKLPAFILLPKKFPNRSNIRGVPPQAATFATRDDVTVPEIYRTLDEAAVLVGNEKTIKDSYTLLHTVKKIHPACIDGVKSIYHWRNGKGLTRALVTTNPFVPAENLFPQQQDLLVTQINVKDAPHSIHHCPGRFSLEIANFEGRKTMDPENDKRFQDKFFAQSPLKTAAEDAERLADSLSKDKDVQQTGYEPYVFHDRFSSRVFMGTFDNPNDPKARELHDKLIRLTVELNQKKITKNVVIVPAPNLTDLAKIKSQIQASPPMQQVRAN